MKQIWNVKIMKNNDFISGFYYGYEYILQTIYDYTKHIFVTVLMCNDPTNNNINQIVNDYNSLKLDSLCNTNWYVIGTGNTVIESLNDYNNKTCNNLKKIGICDNIEQIHEYMNFVRNVLQYSYKENNLCKALFDVKKYSCYEKLSDCDKWELIESVREDYKMSINIKCIEQPSCWYKEIVSLHTDDILIDVMLKHSNFVLIHMECPLSGTTISLISPTSSESMYDHIDDQLNSRKGGYNTEEFFVAYLDGDTNTYIDLYNDFNKTINHHLNKSYGEVSTHSLNKYMEVLKNYKTTILNL